MSKISVIIPTLNEAKNLPLVLDKIPSSIYEIIIIDGFSTDSTLDIAKKYRCKIFMDNRGKGSALRKGLKKASGDIIIMMDADCSHRINEFELLIGGINAGYDICMGSRFLQGGGTADMPLIRRLGNKFFVGLVNTLWSTNYSDLCYGYRSMSRDTVSKLDLRCNSFGIETEMSIKAAKKGLKIIEVPSFEKRRKFGFGKLRTFHDGWRILKTIIREL